MADRSRTTQSGNADAERDDALPDVGSAEDVIEETIELSEDAAELVRRLEQERDEALAARTRALADYSNYQRRASENESRALEQGGSRIAKSILPVLDNFDLALEQEQGTAEQLRAGMKLVHDELVKALEMHGVSRIVPEPGDEFDPNQHEAMFHEARPGFAPNTVVTVLQPGYRFGGAVLRPAKVAVASPAGDE